MMQTDEDDIFGTHGRSGGVGRLQNPEGKPKEMVPRKPWHRRKSTWIIAGLAAIALLIACANGTSPAGSDPNGVVHPPNVETVTSPAPEPNAPGGATAPAAPKPVAVKGTGNVLKKIGATLNGTYELEYDASYNFLIVEFLKADGSDGAGLMESVNEYAESGDVKGSTIVHLEGVTTVKVDNTQGAWTLKFTKVG